MNTPSYYIILYYIILYILYYIIYSSNISKWTIFNSILWEDKSNTIIKIFKDIWKNEYSMIPSYPLFQNCETIVWIIFNSFFTFLIFFTKIHSHVIIKRFKNIWREIRRFQVTQYLKIRLSVWNFELGVSFFAIHNHVKFENWKTIVRVEFLNSIPRSLQRCR